MTVALTPISRAEQALAMASTPKESHDVEAMAAAAVAWAKEQDSYEDLVYAARILIKAWRRTTALSIPFAPEHGGDRGKNQYAEWQDRNGANLPKLDFSFNKDQWSRRKKGLEVSEDKVDEYFDECIEKGAEPTRFGLIKFGTQIIGNTTGDEWWTPKKYIDSVRNVLGEIDLDPASCEEANKVVKAKKIYTEFDNGLDHTWRGRVFTNPPYSANKDFAEKLRNEYDSGNVTEAIALLGAHAIETKWFAPYWDYVLCFTGHRIKFNTPSGQAVAGNISGSVFIHLGEDSHKFAEEFNKHGYVVRRWP